jgi:VWFA-related protein
MLSTKTRNHENHETRTSKGFRVFRVFVCFVAMACGVGRVVFAQEPQPPRFQTGVDVTSIDVNVVDDHGKPIVTLTPADFSVRIDGNARRVISAEWVPLVKPASDAPIVTVPEGFSTNENSTAGRLIVIVVDEPNIRFGAALAISRAANAFIDRLLPSDRVAVAGFGTGAPATVFTADRQRIKQAISRMTGQKQAGTLADLGFNIATSEALAIDRGDPVVTSQVVARECQPMTGRPDPLCPDNVINQAHSHAMDVNREGEQTLNGLRDLFRGLRTIEGPKTLVLISEGFTLTEPAAINELGGLAAAARTSVYAMRLEGPIFSAADSRMPMDPMGDRLAMGQGLEMLAGVTRGALFTVTGTGAALFEQIEAELSGYYLLGVESDPRDRDGKPHPIRVDVPRRGAVVRSRRQLLNTPADERIARSPHQAVAAALASPLLSSALPLRVASFALQGPERDRVQLLIHADVGADYTGSKVTSLAYVIADQAGRMIENRAFDARLLPVVSGVPSALQYSTGASLPPGDYTLKLAVVEGDHVGSIEHPIHASLPQVTSGVTLSELIVGGPLETSELLQPTIGYQVNFGVVHGYIEAYGAKDDGLTVEYEVAKDADSPALLNVDVPPHPAGENRVIFTRTVPVQQLPPGKYLLRAVFSDNGKSIKTLARAFEVAPPKVLMTSADGLSSMSTFDTGLFLPIDEAAMRPAFERDTAVNPSTLEPFLPRIEESIKPKFDQGLAFLTSGDFAKAEASFKEAIDPDTDSTPALAYLAATFAAAGRDIQAAGAWQTALVDGTDFPQIYDWLAGALMRNHAFGEARAILEEAVGKWPTDVRFTKPLAMLYATFGSGREATRTLERYLEERRDDREACYMAVQWIYLVHAAGANVQNRAEDLKAAHAYADAYERAHGSQLALVKQWLEYLDKEKR